MLERGVPGFNVVFINEDPSTGTTYVGKESETGVWVVQKIVETGNDIEISYATQKNNKETKSLSDAWANRTTLSYGNFSEAF